MNKLIYLGMLFIGIAVWGSIFVITDWKNTEQKDKIAMIACYAYGALFLYFGLKKRRSKKRNRSLGSDISE